MLSLVGTLFCGSLKIDMTRVKFAKEHERGRKFEIQQRISSVKDTMHCLWTRGHVWNFKMWRWFIYTIGGAPIFRWKVRHYRRCCHCPKIGLHHYSLRRITFWNCLVLSFVFIMTILLLCQKIFRNLKFCKIQKTFGISSVPLRPIRTVCRSVLCDQMKCAIQWLACVQGISNLDHSCFVKKIENTVKVRSLTVKLNRHLESASKNGMAGSFWPT